jgi:hypothetical protein
MLKFVGTACVVLCLAACSGKSDTKEKKGGSPSPSPSGDGGGGGGSGSAEDVMKDMIKVQTEAADILEGVKDKETAKAAAPKLEELADRLEEVGKKMKKLGEPSKEVQKKLQEKFGADLIKEAVRGEAAKTKALKAAGDQPDFKKAMDKMEKATKSLRTKGSS